MEIVEALWSLIDAFDWLAVHLSFKCPFVVRRVAFAYLRGGSLANGGDAADGEEETVCRNEWEYANGKIVFHVEKVSF